MTAYMQCFCTCVCFQVFSISFHCVSVFFCVCSFYSMDLCGLIQIKKEIKKERRKKTTVSRAATIIS